MSILARYKKRGGFEQLLTLLETSSPEKKAKLFKAIENEDSSMAAELEKKWLTFDKVLSWDTDTVFLVMNKLPVAHMAILCKLMPENNLESLLSAFDDRKNRELSECMNSTPAPLPGEVIAAQTRLFKLVRELNQDHVISLRKLDPELEIPEAA